MPSTSPANAKYTLDKLIQEWDIIKNSNCKVTLSLIIFNSQFDYYPTPFI